MTAGATYLGLLGRKGVLRVFVPALVGRMSFAMVTLAILYAVQEASGSFAIAGAATGAFGIANVIATPYRARIVDSWGQRKALVSMASIYAVAILVLAFVTAQRVEPLAVVVVAGVAGLFPPPLGASMRVLWAVIAEEGTDRRKAYSIDAISEELLFTTGPLIAALVVSQSNPQLALVLTAAAALIGTILMTSSTLSRGRIPRSVTASSRAKRPLRQPGFLPVLVALLGAGVVLGTVEISAPAYAQSLGSPIIAGVLLAAFAAGSAIGGLVYGQIEWKSALTRRLWTLLVAMATLCAALALVPHILALVFGLVLVGGFLAPALVTGYLSVDELTSEEVRTEASSWINTAVNTGAAGASFVIGLVVDTWSPVAGFAAGALVALTCIALAVPFMLRHQRAAGRQHAEVGRE